MKRRKFIFMLLLLGCGIYANSQKVHISPRPQLTEWSDVVFRKSQSVKIIGGKEADQDALNLIKENFTESKKGLKLIIGERGDRSVKKYSEYIPGKNEGYYLRISNDAIVVAGNDEAGTFYGVQTLLQIMQNESFYCLTITDYPDVPQRGVVEGFYGNPWSHKDRLRQFEFYGENKFNIYIYGPKDDPYHREYWREPYPEDMAKRISELAAAAAKNKVHFVWALHPGKDIQWTEEDRMSSINKLEKMYELGIRSFAIFFDDIFGEEQSRADRQADYLNFLQKEFVEKHHDITPLIMCPTEYNKGWAGDTYLPLLGDRLDKDIHIMWTGNTVVDMIDEADMDWINSRIDRNAYVWLNYPVNDFCIDHLLMGPTYGNDKTIASKVSGFVSNPMEYAEASKVSLYSIADYTWNMEKYDEQESWHNALKYVMGDNLDAFRIFCGHNVDLGASRHGLRRAGESDDFRTLIERFEGENASAYDKVQLEAIGNEFGKMIHSADELMSSSAEPELMVEITPWVRVMKLIGERGKLIVSMYDALENNDEKAFVDYYEKQVALEQEQKGIISRDFEGSIKKPNPAVASDVVSPFINRTLKYLVRMYKKNHTYRADLFPMEVLDGGKYYIKCDGMWLTNANANANRTGDFPVWTKDEDLVNPQRQEWVISTEPSSGRYKISNAQDGRFITDKGTFRTSSDIQYDSELHSFDIYRINGKYAIMTTGKTGRMVFVSDGNRVEAKSSGGLNETLFVFDLVPVDDNVSVVHQVINNTSYYNIVNNEGLYLTNSKAALPVFEKADGSDSQKWHLLLDEGNGLYILKSITDGRSVAANAYFRKDDATSQEAVFTLFESGGSYSISIRQGETDKYMIMNGKFPMMTDQVSMPASYLYKLIPIE